MAESPQEWLPVLAKRIDDNMPRVRMLDRYVNGDAPLPEMSRNTSASWRTFQKKARTNWGLLIRDSVADRIVPNGITVGGSADNEAATAAQRVWRDNRLDLVFKQWVQCGLTFGDAYLTCWSGRSDGVPIITADAPDTMGAAVDPLQPWRVRAAMRYWRDVDHELDYAIVWVHGARQKFSRPCYTYTGSRRRIVSRASGTWEPVGDPVTTDGAPPVVVYRNPGGLGEFEAHTDVIDRCNSGMLQRLSTMAMQAFRQRALTSPEGSAGLPETTPDGKPIDWASIFEPAPGALWDIPPGVGVWESQQTDIRPMLDASREDVRQLSAATKTPLPMLMPDSANQSAEGAVNTEKSFNFKCEDRIIIAKLGIEAVLVKALAMMGVPVEDTLSVAFDDPTRVTLSEKYSAAAQARAAGESWGSIRRTILNYSPEQMRQDDIDRAREQLQTFSALNQSQANPSQG